MRSRAERLRRYGAVVIGVILVLPVVAVVAAQGAQNWCQGGEMTFSNFEVSPSLWPPGVRCSFDVPDQGPVKKFWPINW